MLEPYDPRFLYFMGAMLARDGSLAEAEWSLRRSMELDPSYAVPHHQLSLVFILQKRWNEALMESQAAVALDPANVMIQQHHEALVQAAKLRGHTSSAGEPVMSGGAPNPSESSTAIPQAAGSPQDDPNGPGSNASRERLPPAMAPGTRHGLETLRQGGRDIEVGRFSYGVPKVSWSANDRDRKLRIGSYCSIADNVRIYVGVQGRHPLDFLSTYPIAMVFGGQGSAEVSAALQGDLNVEIGSDVWLGLDSIVLAGCKIGHGACVGTRSLVTKDVPPFAIVGGVPAKIIRYRFDSDIIAELLELKWWDWTEEKIRKNLDLFQTANIRNMLERIKE